MTYISWTHDEAPVRDRRRRSRQGAPISFIGALVIATSAVGVAATIAVNGNPWAGGAPVTTSHLSPLSPISRFLPPRPPRTEPFVLAGDGQAMAEPAGLPSAGTVPVEPGWMTAATPFDLRAASLELAQADVEEAAADLVADVATAGIPLPTRNPLLALRTPTAEALADAAQKDTIRLIAPPRPVVGPQPRPERQLASLAPVAPEEERQPRVIERAPEPDEPSTGITLPTPGSRFALYDIEGGMVYLPSGERLEAHSGYGENFDKPTSAHRRMVGPTPPNTYKLTMREALFHGVEAIRLTPIGDGKMYGRDGFLVHTYMLGARGDSNGCVSVRDYQRFLSAYKRGDFNRLVVVPRLPPSAGQTPSLLSWLIPKANAAPAKDR